MQLFSASLKPQILLVEDDPIMQRLYGRAFEESGFEVSTADDGTIVFETVLMRRPSAIVMDMMMPNFNGLDTLRELAGNVQTRGIPVIVLSAYDKPELIDQAKALGAKEYIVKGQQEPADVARSIQVVIGLQP